MYEIRCICILQTGTAPIRRTIESEEALRTAKMLVENHIRYFKEKLANTQQPLFEF